MESYANVLSPSLAYVGPLSYLYRAQSQLERFNRLSKTRLTASPSDLQRLSQHLEDTAAAADSLLDSKEITDTPPPLPTFRELLEEFNVRYESPGRSKFWEIMEAMSRASAVRRWDTRLQLEAFQATEKGWFLVFDTVTYDPNVYSDDVMFGQHWRRYQRSVQHAVVRRVYGSLASFRRSGASFHDHVRYFAVPEAHRDGRTHLHVLWFLSDLPDTCSLADPNAHSPARPRRQVSGWPAYPYGLITMRLPVRYRGDSFSTRLGWRLPLDNRGKRPILKDSNAVARYMAKYLSKPKPASLKCRRIRTSPRLGLRALQAKLSSLASPQLILLLRDPRMRMIDRSLNGIRIPKSLLRLEVLRLIAVRFRNRLRNYHGPTRTLWDTLRPILGIDSRPQLQEHFMPSILLQAASRLQNFIDSVMLTLTNTDISEVRDFLVDHKVSESFVGHAPNYSPSLGIINY